MTTLREHLQAILHRADKGSYNGRPLDSLESIGCHAEAALDILNRSERTVVECGATGAKEYEIPGERVLVTDPLPERIGPGRICECGHTTGCDCRGCLLCKRPVA